MSALRIQKNKEKIVKLLNENIDLEYKLLLKTFHRTYEEERNIGTKKEPNIVKLKFGSWYEWFKDEDKPDERGVRIERNAIIEVSGKRSNGYRLLEYFTVEDI